VKNAKITVGLPNYAMDIAWLAMESLCRQKTGIDWELLIFEDSDQPLGLKFFNDYQPRLEDAGCVKIMYRYDEKRIALNKKWLWMGENASESSLGLVLQASDCYSEPVRIQTAFDCFRAGASWVHSKQGCFYNILTGQMMKYVFQGFTGINIALSIEALRQMPQGCDKWSSVDWWLWQNMPDSEFLVYLDESENWKGGVNTDGFNHISKGRAKHYGDPQPPFVHTYLDIYALLPGEVCDRLLKLKT
jgi:hypothetical protein